MDIDFKLFGALSLKQFINLAVNVVIALIVYTTPLPVVIKWPIMIMFVSLGLALALVTVNGMPFSNWLGNYLEAILTSQRRVWKKTPKAPDILKGNYKEKGKYTTHILSKSVKRSTQFDMPLLSDEAIKAEEISNKEENERFRSIETHIKKNFAEGTKGNVTPVNIPNIAPDLKSPIIEHNKQGLAMDVNLNNPGVVAVKMGDNTTLAYQTPASSDVVKDRNYYRNLINKEKQKPEQTNIDIEESKKPTTLDNNLPDLNKSIEFENISNPDSNQVAFLQNQLKILQDQIISLQTQQKGFENQTEFAKKIDNINQKINTINQPSSQKVAPSIENNNTTVPITNPTKEKVIKKPTTDIPQKTVANQVPNIISGYVIDKNDNPIDQVSIEIKDAQGFPLRKTYSDKKGYFTFRTPLQNGNYIMDFEKVGRRFIDYNLSLNGKILPTYKFKER